MLSRWTQLFASAKGRVAIPRLKARALAHKNSIKEKPPPLGDVPKGAASKDAGVTALHAPKTGGVGHASLSERHESSNGPGTAKANRRHGWMPCFSFSLPTTVFTESRPRCISQSTDYARETAAAGF